MLRMLILNRKSPFEYNDKEYHCHLNLALLVGTGSWLLHTGTKYSLEVCDPDRSTRHATNHHGDVLFTCLLQKQRGLSFSILATLY